MICKIEFTATVPIICLQKYMSSQFCIFLIVACPQAQISSLKTLRFNYGKSICILALLACSASLQTVVKVPSPKRSPPHPPLRSPRPSLQTACFKRTSCRLNKLKSVKNDQAVGLSTAGYKGRSLPKAMGYKFGYYYIFSLNCFQRKKITITQSEILNT